MCLTGNHKTSGLAGLTMSGLPVVSLRKNFTHVSSHWNYSGEVNKLCAVITDELIENNEILKVNRK